PMELLKTEFVEGDPPRLQVDGEIDLSTADQLHRALEHALSADPKAVVDMAGVTVIDVVGGQAGLDVAARRHRGGPPMLVNAPKVAWLRDVVGLSELSSIVIRDEGDSGGR